MDRTPPSEVAVAIARLLKRERPDRHYLKKVFAYVRKELELQGAPPPSKRLPELLTDDEVRCFYGAVWNAADRTHTVMLKLLLFTGIRNAELANLKLGDVDINAGHIRIAGGKGDKDRHVPLPESFRGELQQYLLNQRERRATYLFETNRLDKFTTRWIRALVKRYADQAGIQKRIYPHLFRHQLLTHLAKEHIVDAKIQIISGHADRRSLEIYQNLSLADVQTDYQSAMKNYPVK